MVYKQTTISGPDVGKKKVTRAVSGKTSNHNTATTSKQQKQKKTKGNSYLSTPTLETYDLRAERLGDEFESWAKNVRRENRKSRFKAFYGMEDFEEEKGLSGEDVAQLKKYKHFDLCVHEVKKWLGLHTFAGLLEGSMKETYAKAILTEYSSYYSELIKKQEAYEDGRKIAINADEAKNKGPQVVVIERFPTTDTVPDKKEAEKEE